MRVQRTRESASAWGLFVILSLLASPAVARERVDAAGMRQQALDGINTLWVRVDIFERREVVYGVTADQLDRAVRAKVRDCAFSLGDALSLDEEGQIGPHLAEIEVTINRLETNGKKRVYAVQVGLFQAIDLANPPRHLFARIWGSDIVRAASSASDIRKIVDEEVDFLLSDLAAANPGARHPVPDPQPIAPLTRCELPRPGRAGSVLNVLVKDEWGEVIHGATTRYSREGEPTTEYPTIAWVKPGTWHVEVRAKDFRPASYDFEVFGDKVCRTTVYLEDSNFRFTVFDADCPTCGNRPLLLVKVTDEGGAALPGVVVVLGGSEKASDAEGMVRFGEVLAGSQRLRATLAGFDGGEVSFTALAGRLSVVHVTMSLTPTY